MKSFLINFIVLLHVSHGTVLSGTGGRSPGGEDKEEKGGECREAASADVEGRFFLNITTTKLEGKSVEENFNELL